MDGILENMSAEDLALVKALGLGELHIVGAHLIHNIAARPEHEARDGGQRQRDDGQDPGSHVAGAIGRKDRRQIEERCAEIAEEIDVRE